MIVITFLQSNKVGILHVFAQFDSISLVFFHAEVSHVNGFS